MNIQYVENKLVMQTVYETIWILSKIVAKDKNFTTEVKSLNATEMFLSILKLYYNKNKILFPSLTIIKYLTKNEICCTILVKAGIVQEILKIFTNWKGLNSQLHLKLSKNVIITIQHLIKQETGRKSINSENGLQLLYRFCINFPEDKVYDSLLLRVYKIINQCLNKIKLPVPEISPMKFMFQDHFLTKLEHVQDICNSHTKQVCREKLLACINRVIQPITMYKTVYDLDALISNLTRWNHSNKLLKNYDKVKIKKLNKDNTHLHFESRFESGNLRKAIQIGPREYELILTPDVNSSSQHQWFYFRISNMEAGHLYTFNIINCEKSNSQFNFGMQPILFSVIEALNGRTGWVRKGKDICYYQNYYYKPNSRENYFTISFSLIFPHSYDICYLAYHFPYTYSQLITSIWKWLHTVDSTLIYFRADKLCDTLNGNENPLLTITSPDSFKNPIHKRKVIFLTSRVHPGESNASWIMHGTLEFLLGNSIYVSSLRDDYVFKIIPMLNIEGVINGCNRYGLTKEDLNRCWSSPKRYRHPTIYHTKNLLEYCNRILMISPFIFVDYHGHSRRKNVFLFGCSNSESWNSVDQKLSNESFQYMILPHLMRKNSPVFALSLCSFKVEKKKESTARVAIWREFGVVRSYTLESSFCGCDQGPLAGYHLNIKHLQDVGQDFCKTLGLLKYPEELENIDKSKIYDCCPLQCMKKSSIFRNCIQDRHAKQHILDFF
ncbi:PREDICTED: cytosolic carboxypeptidase 1-like [Ceratosolen solmsi marchali]|uniref:tubulin-glutamate carboxypeptidase n=1 Tax=Ceratosolen solmsi marchali TaxID=326594 RepID=A0AAJ6YSA8_9HYME|nr:PREDICTED: cytosolic carboxypeptidase 1-like [Ceratosolen solmsi marchali]